MNTYTDSQLEDIQYSPEYAEFIMKHGTRPCCDGDMLTLLQEEGYLLEEFLQSISESK